MTTLNTWAVNSGLQAKRTVTNLIIIFITYTLGSISYKLEPKAAPQGWGYAHLARHTKVNKNQH